MRAVPLKAVVFDAYETLALNKPSFWHDSFRELCREQELAVDPLALWNRWLPLERNFRRVRLDRETMQQREPFQSYAEAWTDCFRQVFQEMGIAGDVDAATDVCIAGLGRRPLFSDAAPTLEGLAGRVKLAVLSNADRSYLYPLLEHHGVAGCFDAVRCSEETRSYKPHPGIFEQTLEALGVAPEEAVQVGDTLQEDVLGAKLVGMRTVWVSRSGAAADPAGPAPDYQVRDLRELVRIVDGLIDA